MTYQDIERWKEMSKDELYQELAELYGDMPSIDDITHIYVNNCYELGAEVGGYANEFFVSLHPSGRLPERRKTDYFNLAGSTFIMSEGPKSKPEYLPCKLLGDN